MPGRLLHAEDDEAVNGSRLVIDAYMHLHAVYFIWPQFDGYIFSDTD